jgi:hypothetical protein
MGYFFEYEALEYERALGEEEGDAPDEVEIEAGSNSSPPSERKEESEDDGDPSDM